MSCLFPPARAAGCSWVGIWSPRPPSFEEDATVYAHWRLPGDVNGDGKVNTADVSLLAKYVKAHGQGVTIVPGSGDVNGDGKVNTADVSLLAKFVKAHGEGVVIH